MLKPSKTAFVPFVSVENMMRLVLHIGIEKVLTELAAEDREALELCDIGGMSQKAFAELKGLSLPGAKSRVQRARRRLREQLSVACQVKLDGAGQVCCFVPRPPID